MINSIIAACDMSLAKLARVVADMSLDTRVVLDCDRGEAWATDGKIGVMTRPCFNPLVSGRYVIGQDWAQTLFPHIDRGVTAIYNITCIGFGGLMNRAHANAPLLDEHPQWPLPWPQRRGTECGVIWSYIACSVVRRSIERMSIRIADDNVRVREDKKAFQFRALYTHGQYDRPIKLPVAAIRALAQAVTLPEVVCVRVYDDVGVVAIVAEGISMWMELDSQSADNNM